MICIKSKPKGIQTRQTIEKLAMYHEFCVKKPDQLSCSNGKIYTFTFKNCNPDLA